jgi:sugar (pentulose or hexulose) kinase
VPYFIGIDLGTSGCRAIAINEEEVLVASSKTLFPQKPTTDRQHTQNPFDWWQAIQKTLQLLSQKIDFREVSALSVDGTSASVLLCDQQGDPCTAALMYNDFQSVSEAALIDRYAPADSIARGASSSLAKLLHLLKTTDQARYALHQADWVLGKFSGKYGISDENNALKMGYDPVKRNWPVWIDKLGIPGGLLPLVKTPGTYFENIAPVIANEFGLNPDTRIITGTTDSTAAFLATGANQPGEAVTSLGSTMVIKVISEFPVFAPEYGVYSHRLGDLWLTGGASNAGGAVLLKYFTLEQLKHMTPKLKPAQPTGMDMYPLCSPGERFPENDPDMPPRMPDFPENSPGEQLRYFQGILESIAKIEYRGYRLLEKLGAPYPSSIRTAGGGSTNTAWTEIRTRTLKVPIIQPQYSEAAYGTALLAKRSCCESL